MTIRSLIEVPHFDLVHHGVSINPRDPKVHEVIDDLIDTMHAHKALSLSACQIGHPWALCVMDTAGEGEAPDVWVLINPYICEKPVGDGSGSSDTGTCINTETCVSIRESRGRVERYQWVRVKYQCTDGEWETKRFAGPDARAVQHAIDHIEGVLLIDRMGMREIDDKRLKW